MSNIKIKVNPKRMVRVPETGKRLEAGEIHEVEDSIFWRRRIQSGDVAEIKTGKTTGKKAANKPDDEKPAVPPEDVAEIKTSKTTGKKAEDKPDDEKPAVQPEGDGDESGDGDGEPPADKPKKKSAAKK